MAYARTTLTTLRARLLERVGGQGKFWVTAEIDYALNEALHFWQLLTGDFVDSGNASLAQDAFTATAPSGCISPFRIKDGTTVLTPTTLQDIDQGHYGWRNETASTPAFWACEGTNLIFVDPADSAGTTLACEFYDGDDQLTAAGDYIQLGDEELDAIMDYAQAYLAFKEGPGEGTDNAQALAQMFEAAAGRRAAWLGEWHPYKRESGSGHQAGQESDMSGAQGGIRG
jgi:hypothetical protein